MYWNHRIVKKGYKSGQFEWSTYSIHEIYYNEDGSVHGWVAEMSSPYGESIDELNSDFEMLQKALSLPAIDEKDLPGWGGNNNGE